MNEAIYKKYIEAIVLLQSFDKFWTNYVLSDRQLYPKEARETAKALATKLKEIYLNDRKIFDSKTHRISKKKTVTFCSSFVKELHKWANSSSCLS